MFLRARLKLTAWYVIMSMVISIMFSVVVYRAVLTEVSRFDELQRVRMEERLSAAGYILPQDLRQMRAAHNAELMDEAKVHVITILIIINVGILISVAGVGYMLSAKTLEPIASMIMEQNRFISDASHELKTPLTSLQSGIEVFLRGKKQSLSEAKEILEENLADVKRLQELARSLLQLAQVPGADSTTHRTRVSLDQVIHDSVKSMKRRTETKKIKVLAQLEGVQITAHEDDMSQLVRILLDNAIKYSPTRSTVQVTLQRRKKNGVLTVADEGIGIAEKDIPHIFDRFYRAENARERVGEDGGYGLGLAIAKRIVSRYGGTIMVIKQEKGACFEVALPV